MWMTRKTTTSSDTSRWTVSTAKRGHATADTRIVPAIADDHADGEQHERDHPAAAGQVPVDARPDGAQRASSRTHRGGLGLGLGDEVVTGSAASRRDGGRGRPGSPAGWAGPRRSATATARSPRTIAAVAAMLASRQLAAATLTVRQGPSAGRPDAGSTTWCRLSPPVVQRRTVVLEVARPPRGQGDRLPGRAELGPVIVGHPHRPAAGRRAARRRPGHRRARPAPRSRPAHRRRRPPGRRPAPWPSRRDRV